MAIAVEQREKEESLHRRFRELEETHRATLNILEDFDEERSKLLEFQQATMNILADFDEEKTKLLEFQQATMNILADFDEEKTKLLEFQRATMNILADFDEEKAKLKEFQQGTMNILEDFNEEKARLREFQRGTMNILEDMYEERGRLDDTQRALLNILDDVETERNLAEQSKTLLESVNKELEAFSYSVSHDLRAPLRAVSGFAEAVLEDYSPLLDDGGVKYLGLIAENAKKMSRLIDDLLAFSRIGRREIVKTGINLREIAVQTFNELISQEPGRHVVFNAHHVPEAYGDISMIRQVLVNLLSNAIKFTRPVKAGVIEFGWQRGAYHIRDNGVGFDIEYAGKLFGVFQRLHSEAEFEGTGVGLALAHRIVTRHGGEVWTKSRIGEGATFFFTLPAKGKVGSHWRNRKF